MVHTSRPSLVHIHVLAVRTNETSFTGIISRRHVHDLLPGNSSIIHRCVPLAILITMKLVTRYVTEDDGYI